VTQGARGGRRMIADAADPLAFWICPRLKAMGSRLAFEEVPDPVLNGVTLSPSGLTAYLECEHLARLELEVKRGERVKPVVENLQAELIRRKGEEHEDAYLQQLLDEGRDVVRISSNQGSDPERGLTLFELGARKTIEALLAGREVIYQAMFVDGEWRGIADFVVRQADGSYVAVDTQLARPRSNSGCGSVRTAGLPAMVRRGVLVFSVCPPSVTPPLRTRPA